MKIRYVVAAFIIVGIGIGAFFWGRASNSHAALRGIPRGSATYGSSPTKGPIGPASGDVEYICTNATNGPGTRYSTAIAAVVCYALMVTGIIILLMKFRVYKDTPHTRRLSLIRFMIDRVYDLARWTYAIAEGMDSFMSTYHELMRFSPVRNRMQERREVDVTNHTTERYDQVFP